MVPKSRFVIVAVLLALGYVTPLVAWEADVHFGLTRWLAIEAGFTGPEADDIASGAQLPDDSHYLSPITATMVACTAGEETVSHTVHDTHFPSPKSVRRPPSEREVIPKQVWNRYQITGPPGKVTTRADRRDLGGYLHAFQDSWSHGGQPDVPPPYLCERDLAWGHPLSRGGWMCHLADLTRPWPDDMIAMARATFEVLAAAAGRDRTWDARLQKAVADFGARRDKRSKREWFRLEKFTSVEFVDETSLPECVPAGTCQPQSLTTLVTRWIQKKLGLSADDNALAGLSAIGNAIDAMLNADSSVMNNIDTAAAAISLARTLNVTETCPMLVPSYVRLLLAEGFREGFGARLPESLCERALHQTTRGPVSCKEALASVDAELQARYRYGPTLGEVRSALDKLGRKVPLYRGHVSLFEGQYRAVVEFAHVPHDVLVLTAKDKLITSFAWAPKR